MKAEGRRFSPFKSSHFRITLWYTLLLGLVAIAFGAFVYASQMRDIYGDSRFRATRRIEDASRALDGGFPILAQSDEAYALFDAEGRVLKAIGISEDKARALAQAAAADERGALMQRAGHHGKPISWVEDRVGIEMTFGYSTLGGPPGLPDRAAKPPADGPAAILFGSPLDPYGLRGRLLATLLVAVSLMLAAALVSGAWLANRAMRPVAQIARTARAIGESDLSRRIRLDSRDELGELASVFDAMLDRLEAAFERQKRFVADAGHELRTPLSIISLESERALSSERGAEEYRKSLAAVKSEAGYMAHLVEDLLALAKADSAEATKGFEPVDLADVAVEALERFAPLAASRGVALSAGELPEAIVRGDRAALARMLGNLVDNALKYGGGPGKKVALGLSAGASEAILAVSDEGPGIPPGARDRVFDRFYRVDESRSEAEGGPAGSGLGLAIVKAIAEAHGGRVELRSELGEGSEFSVRLPLAPSAPPAP